MLHGKTDGLVGQQKAENEGQGEGHNDSGIAPPEPEVVPGDGKCLLDFLHSCCNLLPARNANRIAKIRVISNRNMAAPQQPKGQAAGSVHVLG